MENVSWLVGAPLRWRMNYVIVYLMDCCNYFHSWSPEDNPVMTLVMTSGSKFWVIQGNMEIPARWIGTKYCMVNNVSLWHPSFFFLLDYLINCHEICKGLGCNYNSDPLTFHPEPPLSQNRSKLSIILLEVMTTKTLPWASAGNWDNNQFVKISMLVKLY